MTQEETVQLEALWVKMVEETKKHLLSLDLSDNNDLGVVAHAIKEDKYVEFHFDDGIIEIIRDVFNNGCGYEQYRTYVSLSDLKGK